MDATLSPDINNSPHFEPERIALLRAYTRHFLKAIGFKRGSRIWFRISWNLPMELAPSDWRVCRDDKGREWLQNYVGQGTITRKGFTFAFCNPSGRDEWGNCRWQPAQQVEDGWMKLYRLSLRGASVSFYPNQPQDGIADYHVQSCQCIFYETDGTSLTDQRQRLRDFCKATDLKPCAVVFSGGKSLHVYFRINEAIAPDRWAALNRRLVQIQQGDMACTNPARSMRLPGMVRHTAKSLTDPEYAAPKTVSLRGLWKQSQYSYQQLCDILQPQEVQATPVRAKRTNDERVAAKRWIYEDEPEVSSAFCAVPLTLFLTDNNLHWIEYGIREGNRNNIGYALARNLLGTAQYLDKQGISYRPRPRKLFEHFCRICEPAIDPGEAAQIWHSASKQPATPSLSPAKIMLLANRWWQDYDLERREREESQRRRRKRKGRTLSRPSPNDHDTLEESY